MKTIALVILCLSSIIFSKRFLADQQSFGGLHDYIYRETRENLVKWALTTEKYHRKLNSTQFLGGLHDYIDSLTNKEIISIVLKEADEHPEIASKEKLEALAIELEVTIPRKSSSLLVGGDGGIHDFIWRLPRKTLINWALGTEAYHRDVKHQHLFGGLDEYIYRLTNQEIIEYIMIEIKEHPEISSQEKLNSLIQKYSIDSNSMNNHPNLGIGQKGGLNDDIWRTERATLEKWAFAAETYHKEINNQTHFEGGLNDYISKLSNKDVINYIMKEAAEHPEISSSDSLNRLVTKYLTTKKENKPLPLKANIPKSIGGDGGLHDNIWRTERPVLNNWAIATEKYHRNINNLTIIGGIHDFINNLTDKQVIDYIVKEIKEHHELSSGKKLDELVDEYGLNPAKPVEQPKKEMPIIIGGDGGIHDIIFTLPRNKIEEWALACEKLHRKINNTTQVIGGLHDYISTFTNEQITEYILKEVKEHPEISSPSKLDELVVQYNK